MVKRIENDSGRTSASSDSRCGRETRWMYLPDAQNALRLSPSRVGLSCDESEGEIFLARALIAVTLVQHRTPHDVHFFLDFIFQSLNTSSSCNK
jgi:hypothetical protein